MISDDCKRLTANLFLIAGLLSLVAAVMGSLSNSITGSILFVVGTICLVASNNLRLSVRDKKHLEAKLRFNKLMVWLSIIAVILTAVLIVISVVW
ncbi:MAG: hypothetical protein WC307_01110 [Candidatus Nanoarchaeia archaeon]